MNEIHTYRLTRHPSSNDFTVGEVCKVMATGVVGPRKWYTGEDPIREVPGMPVSAWKIAGATAVPAGRYRIIITPSPRFKRLLPRLVDVPGFDGILIHPGNFPGDTEGCIMPGMRADDRAVWQSQIAFDLWYKELESLLLAGDEPWIEIVNPS